MSIVLALEKNARGEGDKLEYYRIENTLIKKKIKFSSYIRKLFWDQLQRHI